MKSVAELLEMPEGELLDYVQSRSPEARAALLAELIEIKRVDQKFLATGFPPEWLTLLHSEILIALGLENDMVERSRERTDIRTIVRRVMSMHGGEP